MMKCLYLTVGVALIGAMGFAIDRQSRPVAQRPERPERPFTICALGRIEGATPEIELRTRLAGRIARVHVVEGQFVEKGDVLLELEDAELRQEAALAAAEVRLAEAQLQRRVNGARKQERDEAAALFHAQKARLERAELTWNRTQELRRTNAVSAQQADDQRTFAATVRAELEAARARLELIEAPARPDDILIDQAGIDAAKARLALAKVQLERARLVAPTSGRILEVVVEPGELTGPDAPEPAVVMVDTSRYRVRAFVDELDAPRIQLGMTVRITADGLPADAISGRVTQASPRMGRKQLWSDDPAERCDTKTREVWIDLDRGEDLVVGLRVDVAIDPTLVTPAPTGPRVPERLPDPDAPAGSLAAAEGRQAVAP
ncbi:MAG: HlyD family efflux transporter periplasmic adaptor subunit [Pirellulales bacterium]|nr:HlyD family efflux transporter periplasmic adaptor subunit [Pirellulales bacterium]